ncbi:Uncharacterised protein [uncultured archaeon]|nr:Uncharacterised protein [uncultured archaeon]
MAKTTVICDSGALISLTSVCLPDVLYFFKDKFKFEFIIPPGVEEETVGYPLGKRIKKYMYSAIRIKEAINDGIVTVMKTDAIDKNRDKMLELANNMFYARGEHIKLLDLGETEMIALAKDLGVENVVLDERTTRMLIESPFRLKDHMEEEFGVNIMVNRNNFNEFSKYVGGLNPFRSSELVMLAYENGYFKRFGDLERDALEASLYSIRFAGCSIRFDEIARYLKGK